MQGFHHTKTNIGFLRHLILFISLPGVCNAVQNRTVNTATFGYQGGNICSRIVVQPVTFSRHGQKREYTVGKPEENEHDGRE